MATVSSRGNSSSTVRLTATTTSSTSRHSSTVKTSSSRISTAPNSPSSPLSSSSWFLSGTTVSSSYTSFTPVTMSGDSGGISNSSIIAIAVVFSVVGVGLLLCSVRLFLARQRNGQKDDAMQTVPNVIFTHHPESLNSRLQVIPHPYDHPGDLQSWINARMDESGNEGGGSSTLASPANSDVPELAVHKPGSPSAPGPPKVPRKPLPYNAKQRGYSDGQSALSSLASPSRGSNGVANRVEAIPIPNGRSHVGWNQAGSVQDRVRGSPYYERTSSELFYATSTHVQAPLESSPTPSSMCIHDRSSHSHEELRGVKIGNIPRNVPLVYFPQDQEGHISARASMHSGNTHVAHIQNMHGFQRTRTSSLPLAQVRKARSVENIVATRKPQALRRPSRKEVPRYVLDEYGQPVDAPNSVDHPGSQLASHSMPFNRPKLHSKSRSVSMAPAIPAQ